MAILGFTGQMSIAVGFVWKGDSVANTISPARKDALYTLANDSVTELSVTALLGGTTRILERKATKAKPLFDSNLHLYVMEPVSSTIIEEFLALPKGARLFLQGVFTYNTFFDAMLEQMTRTDGSSNTLANPDNSKAILDTFTHSGTGGKVSIGYKSKTEKFSALIGTVFDSEVKPPAAGSKVPAVKLMLHIDLSDKAKPAHQTLMRKFVAMDCSKLARFGDPKPPVRSDALIWFENALLFLLNHTDIKRGQRIRNEIVERHKNKSPKQLATDLRADLDAHLITANHWGQAREDLKTETHQRLLSDLFGTLHQKVFLASPVAMARGLRGFFFGDEPDQAAALALQYGTGHCGEHALCSFSVMRSIMKLGNTSLTMLIRSGNANIDHAFVVYNLKPEEVIITKTTNPKNNRKVGSEIVVFDLRRAIDANPPDAGFVMDPYLDKSAMKATAKELLAALNRPDRINSGKDTDFIVFGEPDIHPPQSFPTDDLRSLSDEDRKSLVKNV